jgi:hypothetical protein
MYLAAGGRTITRLPNRTLRVLGCAVLLAGLAVAAFAITLLPSAPEARAQSPSNESLLLQLAQRLLSQSFSSLLTGGSSAPVQLLPGAVPPDLPIELPLPPASTVIGSEVRSSYPSATPVIGGLGFSTSPFPTSPAQTPSGENVTVVLDAQGSPDDVTAFYKNAMTALGWSQPSRSVGFPSGGFLPSFILPTVTTFCETANGPWLSVSARATDSGPLDVRVSLDTGNAGSCSPPSYPPGIVIPSQLGMGLLPSLSAPDGVTVRPTGTSGGGNSTGSAAIASAEMSVDALNAFYTRQLQSAGWVQAGSATAPMLDWSTWSITDHSGYQGFFYVRQGPADGQLSLHVDVSSTDPNANQIGGVYTGSAIAVPSSAALSATSAPLVATPTPTPTPGR